jgi:CRP/FNR family transcriptional regulator
MSSCDACLARRGTLCAALDAAGLRRLQEISQVEEVAAGRWIVHPGDAATTVFILREGHANVARVTRDGKRQILAFAFPGDFFGFTFEERYVYGAWADSDVSICRIPRERFDEFVETTPGFERHLRQQLTRLLDSAQELIFTLGRKNAIERVAAFVWYLQYRQRKLGRERPGAAIPMSRTDIADFLGLTPESVSRAMTRLKRDGLIRLPSPVEVEIPDLARLRDVGVVMAEPAGATAPASRTARPGTAAS